MTKVSFATAIAVASISILTGCSSQPTYRRTVTGTFVAEGGGPSGSSVPQVPVAGTVVARSAAGDQFSVVTDKNGRFQLSLPRGIYRLTGIGHNPRCGGVRIIHVTKNEPVRNVLVACVGA